MTHIITALHAEAKPLISHFKLSRVDGSNIFEAYANPTQTITLSISGIGKLSSAAAVIHAINIFPSSNIRSWLNIGIAGHKSLDIGTPVIANKIIDKGSKQSWFPQIVFKSHLMSLPIMTLDTATDLYPDGFMLDMESAGFYSSACKVATCELIHCLKIISDNEHTHYRKLDKKKIQSLIEINIEDIVSLVDGLNRLSLEIHENTYDENIFNTLTSIQHFTHSHKIQLKKILKKWEILFPKTEPDMNRIYKFKNAREILDYLMFTIDKTPVSY